MFSSINMKSIQVIALSVLIIGSIYFGYVEIKKINNKLDFMNKQINKINSERDNERSTKSKTKTKKNY